MGQDITKPLDDTAAEKLGINVVISEESWDPCKSFKLEFKGKDETYGKPPEGSLTEARAKKACQHINKELSTLLCIIREIGTRADNNSNITVTFQKLFRYYIPISDKIVGLLLRARRWRLVDFTGEMLYQGQDDDKIITLLLADENMPYSRGYDFSLSSNSSPQPDAQYDFCKTFDDEESFEDSPSVSLLKSEDSTPLLSIKETDSLLLSR
ncbi:actin-binding Rho-activating protein-like [Watersipora subatra]|uniref:actin-binding Rho-activating protein-like n=1 Tax=Watersipora subatra TaxID=2589382 RepID=UPI00355BEECE